MAPASPPVDIVLKPGEFAVGTREARMRTLLGSCVSIVLWHARLQVGAMSHFLLAARGRPAERLDARYGDEALQLMVAGLARHGVAAADCIAKIFGGGNMFPDHPHASAAHHVGQRNGEAARALLRTHGIPVVCEHLFGNGHRQIVFEVATGDVWVRQTVVPSGLMPLETR